MNYYVTRVAGNTVTIGSELGEEQLTLEEIFLLAPLEIQGVKYFKTKASASQYKGMDYGDLYLNGTYVSRGFRYYTVLNVMNGAEMSFKLHELTNFASKTPRGIHGVSYDKDGWHVNPYGDRGMMNANSARAMLVSKIKSDISESGELIYLDLNQFEDNQVVDLGTICSSIHKKAIHSSKKEAKCILKFDDRIKSVQAGWLDAKMVSIDVTDVKDYKLKSQLYAYHKTCKYIDNDEYERDYWDFLISNKANKPYRLRFPETDKRYLELYRDKLISEVDSLQYPPGGVYDNWASNFEILAGYLEDGTIARLTIVKRGVILRLFRLTYLKKKLLIFGYIANGGSNPEILEMMISKLRSIVAEGSHAV